MVENPDHFDPNEVLSKIFSRPRKPSKLVPLQERVFEMTKDYEEILAEGPQPEDELDRKIREFFEKTTE